MIKHRGFPGRLPGTDFQFTIRRPSKGGATPLKARERYADRRPADRRADSGFMAALWAQFGAEPFEGPPVSSFDSFDALVAASPRSSDE